MEYSWNRQWFLLWWHKTGIVWLPDSERKLIILMVTWEFKVCDFSLKWALTFCSNHLNILAYFLDD